MRGAIIGDIIGSYYEFNNTDDYNFKLFTQDSKFTDDTICSIAIAHCILDHEDDLINAPYGNYLGDYAVKYMSRGFGGMFKKWAKSWDRQPYDSWGNGAPMRASPVGWLDSSLSNVFDVAEATCLPTHGHKDAIKAAKYVASSIYVIRHKLMNWQEHAEVWYKQIKHTSEHTRKFDVSSAGTMPRVISCINEGTDFEDTIRIAVIMGGDSDTNAAIAGSIIQPIYGIPTKLWEIAEQYLDDNMKYVLNKYEEKYGTR